MESFAASLHILFFILIFSSFVKVFVALNIFRYGLGLTQSGIGIVFFLFSLVLAFFQFAPYLGGHEELMAITSANGASSDHHENRKEVGISELLKNQNYNKIRAIVEPMLRENIDETYLQKFTEIQRLNSVRIQEEQQKNNPAVNNEEGLSKQIHSDPKKSEAELKETRKDQVDAPQKASFPTLLLAYFVTQLSLAFKIGLMLMIPFIVIDVLIVNVLLSLDITQIQQELISLPLKLILFVALDGWALITQKLF
jgi:flagellar biosynthesis protein FliP